MGAGPTTGTRSRGGAEIPTLRTPGTPDTRLIAAASALATCAALAVYPAVAGRPFIALLLPGGAAALLLVTSVATGWAAAIPWALGMLGGEYMVSVYVRGGSAAPAAAVYGSGLLLLAELAYWCLERQTPSHDEAGLTMRRALAVTLLVLGSLGLGLLVATVTQVVSLTGSLLLTAIGVTAAAVALALVGTLAWRLRP